jgi:protein gp37
MADGTHIEWTDATWNPITGCSIVSPGCTNCYAMKLAGTRLKHIPSRKGLTKDTKAGPVWTGEVRLNEEWLDQPLRWKKRRMIFVCAHADLFYEAVPVEWIVKVIAISIAGWLLNGHTLQILTKRSARMRVLLSSADFWEEVNMAVRDLVRHHYDSLTIDDYGPENPCPGLWLGVSVEDQVRADERREPLGALASHGWLTFVSYEPALGQIDWTGWEFLRWMISGGESGKDARPNHPDWHRATRDFAASHSIAYLFKQWGAWKPTSSVDGYWHGPDRNRRGYPNSEGISWLADGRICFRDFTVSQHAVRIRNGKAFNTRAVEVNEEAIAEYHRSVDDSARLLDNPLGYQWMYNVGKKAAGRLLDGVEHNGFPERVA